MLKLLRYYFTASTKYNLHSPFLYQFIRRCIDNNDQYYAYQKISEWTGRKHASAYNGRIIHKMVNFIKPDQTIVIGKEIALSWYAKLADTRREVIFVSSIEQNTALATTLPQSTERPHITTKNMAGIVPIIGSEKHIILIIEDVPTQAMKVLEECIHNGKNKLIVFCARKHSNDSNRTLWNNLMTSSGEGLFVDFYKTGIYFRLPELSRESIAYISYLLKPWNIGLFGK